MRLLNAAVLAALAALTGAAGAFAQTYPSRPLSFVVPLPPGGTADVVTRIIAEHMAKKLGQPVVVENKPGASTMLGTGQVARSAPDGYTLLFATDAIAVNAVLGKDVPYDGAKDLEGIARMATLPLVVVAQPYDRFDSLKAALQAAKANPGKLNFAHSGNGSAPHLAGVVFRQRTGVEWVEIPYRGGAAAIADVVSGQADFLFNGALATLTFVQNNQLKAIAVSGKSRLPQLPDVPTIAESGLPGFETGTYQGLMATGGTPANIVLQINQAVHAALKQPDITARLASLGTDPTPNSPAEFKTWFDASVVSWAKIVKDAGVKVE